MRRHFLGTRLRSPRVGTIALEFKALPYLPYKPVVWQQLKILRLVNAKRKTAGKAPVPETCIKKRRAIVRPFDWDAADYDPALDYAACSSGGAGKYASNAA